MNTLYLLGGPPRTAKSTISRSLMAQLGIPVISSDAVAQGLRNVFIDEPFQMLRSIEFNGIAEYKQSVELGGDKKPFSKNSNEADLTQQAILGMLDHYARNNTDVIVEGSVISPEWVASLDLPDFSVKPAFVGYTNDNHADSIINYARANPEDWMNKWLEDNDGGEAKVRAWITKQALASQELKQQAESQGYAFFDISKQLFEDYLSSVQRYFIES